MTQLTYRGVRYQAPKLDPGLIQYFMNRKAEAEAVERFEARIQDVIGLGAGDRKTALRWISSQETFYHEQSVEHFVWEQGVLFTDYGRKLVEELAEVVTYEEIDWAA